jgi:glycopeptide antibiotics resistance protein
VATTSGTLAAVLVMIAVAGLALFVWRQRRQSPSGAAISTIRDFTLIAAVAIIVVLTLNPNDQDSQTRRWQLMPFEDLRSALAGQQSLQLAIIEIVGNVALFVPFGVALRWRFPRLGLTQAAGIAFGTSVLIEVIQAVIPGSRWSDTTDVITNVAGALLGAALPGHRTDDGASVRGPPGPR